MPHIQAYYSSQTEALIESLLFQLENNENSPVNAPFARAQILVPNSGMQRYLELKIAERFGICSHIDIHYVGQLLSATYKAVLDNQAPAHIDERLLTFALLRLWDKQIFPMDSLFGKLHQQHRQARQRYLWAQKIAQLLRQYVNERPEMIDRWQAGKLATKHPHESWQRDVFQQLFGSLASMPISRLEWQKRFATALADGVPHGLPDYVHVFGFHAMPAAQLTDLLALGQVCSLNFYTFNPCVAYWQDIVPEKIKTRLAITDADAAKLLTVGHPLLASWGQSGKFYIEQLNEFPSYNLDEIVEPPKPNSVLTWLQHDIRQLSETDSANNDGANDSANNDVSVDTLFEQERAHIAQLTQSAQPAEQNGQNAQDADGYQPYSITLNACSNPRREVEVLYDNLCQRFAAQDLNPADVLVIIPKLSDYAPHIQAIFSRDKDHISIPYSLANQSTAESEPDVQAFLSLLDVLDGDFQAQLLFEALSEARIQEALNLSQSHLDNLRYWFVESRFSLNFYDNSAGESSSLEKLIDSLVLASVGGAEAELGNRHASPLYHGGQLEPLTQLCELWQRFAPFTTLKNKRLSLADWRDKLRELCTTFLPLRHAMDDWLNNWYETLSAVEEQSAQATTYDFATVRADLSALLQNDTLHGPFLSGGVSFCAVVPMRSIPAKMIAVLGLDSDFPAVSAKNPLDLRLDKPLWSDRNPHKEQQYFFLETLMAARETLYLSHVGIDEKTGEDIPPSALVRELFGYLERFVPDFAKQVTRRYPLQGFVSRHSYQTLYATPESAPEPNAGIHPRYSAQTENTEITERTNHTDMYLPDVLTAREIADCLLEPLSAFWRYHLGAVPLDKLTEPLAEHEFIATDSGLDAWHYRQTALANALSADEAESDNAAIAELQRQNCYAPPVISDALLANASDYTRPLLEAIQALKLEAEPEEINAQFKHAFYFANNELSHDSDHELSRKSVYLRLRAQRYSKQGLLSYQVGKWDAKKMLRQWITHVLYHCQADVKPCQSLSLTLDKNHYTGKIYANKKVIKPFADRQSALNVLDKLLALTNAVIQHPYPVALQKSWSNAETMMHYVAADYDLYASIPPADADKVAQLQTLWAEIDAAWRGLS